MQRSRFLVKTFVDMGLYEDAEHAPALEETSAHTDVHAPPVQYTPVGWVRMAAGFLMVLASGVLCSVAGIGGGGILVAVLMFVGGLPPYFAIPLSKFVVFAGALVSLVVNRVFRTLGLPGQRGCLVDYDIVRLVAPAALCGTFVGVLANVRLPTWVIVVVLFAVLCTMTVLTAREAWAQNQKEADTAVPNQQDPQAGAEFPEAHKPCNSLTAVDCSLLSMLLALIVVSGAVMYRVTVCQEEHGKARILRKPDIEGCRHPLLTTLFGHFLEAQLEDQHWAALLGPVVAAVPIGACFAMAAYYHAGLLARQEVAWPQRKILIFQVVSVATGILSGLVGIGGGLILSPLFLLMQVDPAVAVSTSSTCVIFTSASTTSQYLLMGRILIPIALFYSGANVAASILGTCVVHALAIQAGGKATLTSVVAVSVAISAVLMALELVHRVTSGGAAAS